MLDLQKEWSISFAGCGFMGIYYVGASSCLLQLCPRLVQEASRIYGSSSGSLMAAVLASGVPLERCCADLMSMAKEARRRSLGPLHPAFSLLHIVRDSLQRSLPQDAHVRASGRLCVSLTRVPDGKNQLVSEFDSRDELIQVLLCSCFVPFYCGVVPPTYRGQHYVDGAISDNLPLCHLKNTITFSAYAGESDVCPPVDTLNLHEVRFNNVSIHVSSENLHRVTSTFFPPDPQEMSQICQSGFVDARRFLQENNLINSDCPLSGLKTAPCCEQMGEESGESVEPEGCRRRREDHSWLDPKLIDELPLNIRRVLCESCQDSDSADGLLSHVVDLLPKSVMSYLQTSRTLPVDSACSLAHRLSKWIPDVPRDMSWFSGLAADIYKQAWKDKMVMDSDSALHRCSSLPFNMWNCNRAQDVSTPPATPEATATSTPNFTWEPHSAEDHMPLTPPPTPEWEGTEGPQGAGGRWGLGKAVGWIRNVRVFEQNPKSKKTEVSSSCPSV